MNRIWLIALRALALVSCVQEAFLPEEQPDERPETVTGTVTIPFCVSGEELAGPSTRTVALGKDTPMESLYVAVFGGSGYLKEYVKTTNLTRSDTTYVDRYGVSRTVALYRFSVTLTLTDNKRILHFIGNGPPTLSFGYADAVMPRLLSGSGARSYWQMKTVDGIRAKKSQLDGYYVDGNGNRVYKGDFIDKDNNKVMNGEGSHFTPVSYAVINVPSRGTIVPYSAAMGFVSNYQNYAFEAQVDTGYEANMPVGTDFDDSVPSALSGT